MEPDRVSAETLNWPESSKARRIAVPSVPLALQVKQNTVYKPKWKTKVARMTYTSNDDVPDFRGHCEGSLDNKFEL